LGQRVRLRRTPEVVFHEDRSIERGTQVLSLLNRLSQERPEPQDEKLEGALSGHGINAQSADHQFVQDKLIDHQLTDHKLTGNELDDELGDEFDDNEDDNEIVAAEE
jgi:ribosome-binding factor A